MRERYTRRFEGSRLQVSFKLLELIQDEISRQSWATVDEREALLRDVASLFERLSRLDMIEESRRVEGATYPRLEVRGRKDA